MREFIIKTVIVCSLTGAWCGVTLAEFGPLLKKTERQAVTSSKPDQVDATERPKGRFGSGASEDVIGE